MTKRFGFTLAEVLITLTIIGVIAAMTIPTLLSNTSDQEFKTGYKKAISTINQAITMQYALDGTDMTDFVSATKDQRDGELFNTTTGVFGAIFQQRMQVVSTTTSRNTAAHPGTSNAAIYLSDGMVIEIANAKRGEGGSNCKDASVAYNAASNPDGCLFSILVDVNGDKGKCSFTEQKQYTNNKIYAKDCFLLNVHPDGVRPGNWAGREIMYNGK